MKQTFTVDYTQDLQGMWTARPRAFWIHDELVVLDRTPPRADYADCITDVFDLLGWDAKIEVGDVRGDLFLGEVPEELAR